MPAIITNDYVAMATKLFAVAPLADDENLVLAIYTSDGRVDLVFDGADTVKSWAGLLFYKLTAHDLM